MSPGPSGSWEDSCCRGRATARRRESGNRNGPNRANPCTSPALRHSARRRGSRCGDARRELPTGGQDLEQEEVASEYPEDRDRVAPGVDGVELVRLRVVNERVLGGQVVYDRGGLDPAVVRQCCRCRRSRAPRLILGPKTSIGCRWASRSGRRRSPRGRTPLIGVHGWSGLGRARGGCVAATGATTNASAKSARVAIGKSDSEFHSVSLFRVDSCLRTGCNTGPITNGPSGSYDSRNSPVTEGPIQARQGASLSDGRSGSEGARSRRRLERQRGRYEVPGA